MFSTLLIAIALVGNGFLPATAEHTATQENNRQNRQIWLPPSYPNYVNSLNFNRHLLQLAYFSEYLRRQQSSLSGLVTVISIGKINKIINLF